MTGRAGWGHKAASSLAVLLANSSVTVTSKVHPLCGLVCFEMRSHYLAQDGSKLVILLSLPPDLLGSQESAQFTLFFDSLCACLTQ